MRTKLFALFGILSLSTTAQAGIIPYGVQINTSASVVTGDWGWAECYSTGGGSNGIAVSSITSSCSGDSLMMAVRRVGSDTFDILGAASFATVTQYTALPYHTDTLTGNDENGISWYLNDWSWGFTQAGNTVNQYTADTNLYSSPWDGAGDRTYDNIGLSYHTYSGGAGTILSSGWGFNNGIWQSLYSGYERVWLTTSATSVPEPGTLALFGLGLAGLGVMRRRRAA